MRIPLVAAALTVILTGCATVRVVGPEQTIKVGQATVTVSGLEGFNPVTVQAPDPNAPNVFIVNGNVVLGEDPLYPVHLQNRVVIIWRLDASASSPYFFPDDRAIELHAGVNNPLPAGLECGAFGPKKKSFVCTYPRPETPKKWKYTVRVKNTSGADPTPLDPWVHQN